MKSVCKQIDDPQITNDRSKKDKLEATSYLDFRVIKSLYLLSMSKLFKTPLTLVSHHSVFLYYIIAEMWYRNSYKFSTNH